MFPRRGIITRLSLFLISIFIITSPAFAIQPKGDNEAHQVHGVFAPKGDVLLTAPKGPSDNTMTIQVLVPDLEVKNKKIQGKTYQKIRLKGYGFTSQVGKPQLPVKGFLLAVPEGASMQVRVLKSESVAISGYKIYPAPKLGARETRDGALQTVEEFALDQATYSTDSYYPDKLAEIGFYGYMREVRVAQLKVFPLQYNPATGELLHHRKIWLEVKLTGGSFPPMETSEGGYIGKDNPFGAIYRNTILNYSPGLTGAGNNLGGMWKFDADLDYLDNDPYKMSIEEDGIYEIGYQDLANAGVDLAEVDPRTIKIFNLGEEISISVTGEEDGVFDPADYIEFFGLGNKGEFSFSNIYWLSWGGDLGLRMQQRDCSPGDSLPVPTSFIQNLHFEEDVRYYANLYNGEGEDHWFWDQLNAPKSIKYTVKVPDVSDDPTDAWVTIGLRGKTSGDHGAQVQLNGHLIADCTWYGMVKYEDDFSFPQSYLNSGDNELLIFAHLSGSQFFSNWFDIEYQRDYSAHEGCLRFLDSEPEPNQFEIHGFPDSLVELFQITEPTRVIRMVDHSVISEGMDYKLAFEDSLGPHEYYAITPECRKKPSSIVKDESSDLHSPGGRADYIIITHENFYDGVQQLEDFREAEGLTGKTVKIDDVYDEFSYGNFDPRAIKDFLGYTYYNWPQPAPSYVLLVGDASYDYKGNLAESNLNYVPTHLFASQTTLEVSSDDWFVYLVGDDMLTDMLIGRLTAQTTADLEAQVDKIRNYETALPEGDWRQNFLLVCDAPDEGGDFESICDNFANNYIIPAGFNVSTCYVSDCQTGCRQCIRDALNEGRVMCNFVGHGSMDTWSKQFIFQSMDVLLLTNGGKQPFVVTMNCLNGFFHHATDDYCFAEEFVRARNKGAIACLSHSGLDYAYCSEIIGCQLYDALLNDGDYILGSAVCQTKTGYLTTGLYFWDQAMMLILFGDPALELGFTGKPDLLPGHITFRPLCPVAGKKDSVTAVIYNAGREDASDISVRYFQGHPDSSYATVISDITVPYLQAGGRGDAVAVWDSVPDAGTYEIFVQVDVENQINESNEWNNTLWDVIRILPPGEVQDTIPPIVELFVDDEKVGAEFQSNDYTSPSPEIEALLIDHWSGVNTGAIHATLNGEQIFDFELDRDNVGADSVIMSYNPQSLPNGRYTLAVSVTDCANNPNSASCSVAFKIESSLRLINVKNYPNPSRGKTSFAYSLSQNADDVTIEIYSVTGQLLRTIRCGPGRRNSNVAGWSGTDLNGNKVASGVYLYKVTARGKGGQTENTGKMVVVR